jgi:hypothetical protein
MAPYMAIAIAPFTSTEADEVLNPSSNQSTENERPDATEEVVDPMPGVVPGRPLPKSYSAKLTSCLMVIIIPAPEASRTG